MILNLYFKEENRGSQGAHKYNICYGRRIGTLVPIECLGRRTDCHNFALGTDSESQKLGVPIIIFRGSDSYQD